MTRPPRLSKQSHSWILYSPSSPISCTSRAHNSRGSTLTYSTRRCVCISPVRRARLHLVRRTEPLTRGCGPLIQHNVEAAHTEVTKYFQSVTTNRGLIIKTFLTLIVLFALFVLFK